jgi:hypothetical protein
MVMAESQRRFKDKQDRLARQRLTTIDHIGNRHPMPANTAAASFFSVSSIRARTNALAAMMVPPLASSLDCGSHEAQGLTTDAQGRFDACDGDCIHT